MKPLLSLCLALPMLCHSAEKNWDYYQTILNSGMFPSIPVVVPQDREFVTPQQPEIRWDIDYRINMVYQHLETGDIMVGVQNIKGPRNFVLRVGDFHRKEGIRVRDAVRDGELTVVTLEKDGKTAQFPIRHAVGAPEKPFSPVSRVPKPRR